MVKYLVDTNVLVSEALWTAFEAITVLQPQANREFVTTTEVEQELRRIIHRVYAQRSSTLLERCVADRISRLTVLDTAELPAEFHHVDPKLVRDPDDAFIDTACRGFRLDAVITDDTAAFRHPENLRYRVLASTQALFELWAAEPGPRVVEFQAAWQELYGAYCQRVGVEPNPAPVFDQLRRARAGRFTSHLKNLARQE